VSSRTALSLGKLPVGLETYVLNPPIFTIWPERTLELAKEYDLLLLKLMHRRTDWHAMVSDTANAMNTGAHRGCGNKLSRHGGKSGALQHFLKVDTQFTGSEDADSE
jgi:hypothetical protein